MTTAPAPAAWSDPKDKQTDSVYVPNPTVPDPPEPYEVALHRTMEQPHTSVKTILLKLVLPTCKLKIQILPEKKSNASPKERLNHLMRDS
jgi:hypothetical protein